MYVAPVKKREPLVQLGTGQTMRLQDIDRQAGRAVDRVTQMKASLNRGTRPPRQVTRMVVADLSLMLQALTDLVATDRLVTDTGLRIFLYTHAARVQLERLRRPGVTLRTQKPPPPGYEAAAAVIVRAMELLVWRYEMQEPGFVATAKRLRAYLEANQGADPSGSLRRRLKALTRPRLEVDPRLEEETTALADRAIEIADELLQRDRDIAVEYQTLVVEAVRLIDGQIDYILLDQMAVPSANLSRLLWHMTQALQAMGEALGEDIVWPPTPDLLDTYSIGVRLRRVVQALIAIGLVLAKQGLWSDQIDALYIDLIEHLSSRPELAQPNAQQIETLRRLRTLAAPITPERRRRATPSPPSVSPMTPSPPGTPPRRVPSPTAVGVPPLPVVTAPMGEIAFRKVLAERRVQIKTTRHAYNAMTARLKTKEAGGEPADEEEWIAVLNAGLRVIEQTMAALRTHDAVEGLHSSRNTRVIWKAFDRISASIAVIVRTRLSPERRERLGPPPILVPANIRTAVTMRQPQQVRALLSAWGTMLWHGLWSAADSVYFAAVVQNMWRGGRGKGLRDPRQHPDQTFAIADIRERIRTFILDPQRTVVVPQSVRDFLSGVPFLPTAPGTRLVPSFVNWLDKTRAAWDRVPDATLDSVQATIAKNEKQLEDPGVRVPMSLVAFLQSVVTMLEEWEQDPFVSSDAMRDRIRDLIVRARAVSERVLRTWQELNGVTVAHTRPLKRPRINAHWLSHAARDSHGI